MTTLKSWPDISRRFRDAILIGNGASRAVSPSFDYRSLLEVAARSHLRHRLQAQDRKVFELVNETDFERVLGEIDRAASIAQLAGVKDPSPLERQYGRVRDSLVDAVHDVHPLHGDLDSDRLTVVRDSLLSFDTVFTTNYDLLLYWSMTSAKGEKLDRFRDYFWKPDLSFDPTDTGVMAGKTRVLYLHGALHLFELPDGLTVKGSGAPPGVWSAYSPFLALTFDHRGARYPLIVSEGSPEKKTGAIGSNAYLNFAFGEWIDQSLGRQRRSLVVFGHSLSAQDDHLLKPLLVKAERAERSRRALSEIAVSVRPSGRAEDRQARMDYYRRRLGRRDVVFFDATTHPLGSP